MAATQNYTCPEPFLPVYQFPRLGGDLNARFCTQFPISGQPECCLPCPKQNFFYPDRFQKMIHSTVYINLVSVVCCCLLLISFGVLPIEATRRHYLSVCLTVAILLLQLSFVVPLGNKMHQCYDPITPHDMYSSVNCALSGALVLGGGWCAVMWVFLRALSLHLQICWQVVPGRKFFLGAQMVGWSIPVVFLAAAMSVTGVSFRFGESCHINSKHGIQTFWGPMLAMAAASIVTQFVTFGYVTQVYLRSLFEEKPAGTQASSGSINQYSASVRTVTAYQALRRIRKVLALQWRGIFVVVIILADVIFFSTVFLQFDGTTQKNETNTSHTMEWLVCMLRHEGQKDLCLEQASKLVVSEGTAFSVLFLLSFNGIWALILLGQPSIYPAWFAMIKQCFVPLRSPDEFVSYNARRTPEATDAAYEMLESKARASEIADLKPTTPETAVVRTDLTSSLREYNPSTFSAHMRGRPPLDIAPTTAAPYPTYVDLEAGSRRSPPPPPFSQFDDSAAGASWNPPPFSPYADGNTPSRSPVMFPEGARIGFAK